MITSNGALVGILSTHFPDIHRPTDAELRNLQRVAHVAADALLSFRVNGHDIGSEIKSSRKLLDESHHTLERMNRLLARDPFVGTN